jgi:hypothetical protein
LTAPAGEIDALGADEIIHHYHRAAQELWKFCWSVGAGANIELIDGIIARQSVSGERVDWWQRGQPRRPRWALTVRGGAAQRCRHSGGWAAVIGAAADTSTSPPHGGLLG